MVRAVTIGFCLFSISLTLVNASVGDRLPEFKECVEVSQEIYSERLEEFPPMKTSRLARVQIARGEM